VVGQTDDRTLLENSVNRVWDRLSRLLIDKNTHVMPGPTDRLTLVPTDEILRDRIHSRDAAVCVSRDDSVTNAGQRYRKALLGLECGHRAPAPSLIEHTDDYSRRREHDEAEHFGAVVDGERQSRWDPEIVGKERAQGGCQETRPQSTEPRREHYGGIERDVWEANAPKWVQRHPQSGRDDDQGDGEPIAGGGGDRDYSKAHDNPRDS
jgi:hypothetical protein